MATHIKTQEEPSIKHPLEGTADYFDGYGAEEVSLFDLVLPLLEKRRLIGIWVLCFAVIGVLVAFLLPVKYSATAEIMPPQAATSTASATLGQLGALAGLAGKDIGLKNPSDLYVGIIKSRSVADAIIQQFGLQSYYHKKYLSDTRKRLENNADVTSGKDGLITIKYEDKSPKLAADIANAYVAELYQANKRLAISEASQRRLFYEKELEAEKDRLADAEVALKKTQESTGLIQLSSQADAIIRSVAQVQTQLSAKQVQLKAMMSYATADNPDVIRTEHEIAALQQQLTDVERNNKLGKGNIAVPTGKIPEAGLEYVRKLRDVKYHEELFEVLAKQFEAAKIDEGKSAPLIQVVDTAIVPDKRSSPMRSVIIGLSIFLGGFLGCVYVWMSGAFAKLRRDPAQRSRLEAIRDSLHRPATRTR